MTPIVSAVRHPETGMSDLRDGMDSCFAWAAERIVRGGEGGTPLHGQGEHQLARFPDAVGRSKGGVKVIFQQLERVIFYGDLPWWRGTPCLFLRD
jgi:hypothetical protein